MRKKVWEVNVDVTMSGYVYIRADSPEEAEAKVKELRFVASDLRNFCNTATEPYNEPVECEEDPDYYGLEDEEQEYYVS